jgi:hypothetical protein
MCKTLWIEHGDAIEAPTAGERVAGPDTMLTIFLLISREFSAMPARFYT